MKNNFIVELIKTKNSKYFKISLIIPLIFLMFSLLTILTTTNSGGLSNGQSIIQSSIYNLWSFIILPVTIVLIINNDKKQENKALGHQTALVNNWSLQKIYLSKIFKYWTLILLSQFVLLLVIQISNLLTVHQVTSINKNIFILFIIWLGIFPLIIKIFECNDCCNYKYSNTSNYFIFFRFDIFKNVFFESMVICIKNCHSFTY